MNRPSPAMRPYVHVFVAYAITILAVFGWVFALNRRIARLERKLGDR